jgi:hypothetical protein
MPSDFDQLVRQHGARIRRIALRYAASGAVDDFYSVWLAMCALVYWLCRREITRKFDPLLSRLKGLYRELVEN